MNYKNCLYKRLYHIYVILVNGYSSQNNLAQIFNFICFVQGYLAKVITGVRRSEKSVLLKKIMEELLAYGIDLNKEIKSRIRDDEKYYISLDEIQHIKDFEKALASFRASVVPFSLNRHHQT